MSNLTPLEICTVGIDVGSTTSKCVILKDGKEIIYKNLVYSGAGSLASKQLISDSVEKSGIASESVAYIMATGYGRKSIKEADAEKSELTCHSKGAGFILPGVRTVIDIGGQDSKILSLDPKSGNLINFVMNDKCAAGTGRFLEVMARAIGVDFTELEELGDKSTKKIDISSTCTVFAESEVISHLSHDETREDIIAGIHRSIALKVGGQAMRLGVEEPVLITGGVASDKGVVRALEKELSVTIHSSDLSQYAGAIGAAVLAYEAVNKND